MTHLMENTLLNVKNRSHVVSAELTIPDGWCARCARRPGRPVRRLGAVRARRQARLLAQLVQLSELYTVRGTRAAPPATCRCSTSSTSTVAKPGAGGTGTLLVNGEVVAEGRIDKTVPFVFSADETMDIGQDTASPVVDDYGEGPGERVHRRIHWVQIDIEDDDVSHTEDPEQTYHRIMARQ